MSVGRICTRTVDLADLDETAQVAASRMNSRNVGTLVVLDDEKAPLVLSRTETSALRCRQGIGPEHDYGGVGDERCPGKRDRKHTNRNSARDDAPRRPSPATGGGRSESTGRPD